MPRGIDYQTDTPVLTDYVWFWSNATGRLRKTTVQSLLSYVQFEDILLLGYSGGSGTALTANTWTNVPWNTVLEAGGGFSGITASDTITIPADGRYQMIFTSAVVPLSGTRDISYRFIVNGAVLNGSGHTKVNSVQANLPCQGHPVWLNAGDTVRAQCHIAGTSGVLGFSTGSDQNYISIRRVG